MTKEAYAIFMTFKKLSCDAKVILMIMQPHKKSKVNNLRTDIASMIHMTFEHIKGTENILADCISRLRCAFMIGWVLKKQEGVI